MGMGRDTKGTSQNEKLPPGNIHLSDVELFCSNAGISDARI